ncbi:MAG: PD-(D/E)XK nuclease family protein [Candidatus Liptonbacteria bacterium]|nr:PD-(D/E)XK nuclease family protein [Candidatus Liptonbacteria bacterium]
MAEKNGTDAARWAYRRRTSNLFDPASTKPFVLSRTRLENFLRCPRCFYLDRRLGVDQPAGFPFSLNAAVDHLLKKEFDIYRASREPHPLMKKHRIDAIPFAHDQLEEWRDTRRGITHLHEPTNLIITGAVDDIWIAPDGELMIVDYKATAKDGEVTLDAEWQGGYKRQMEIYQWLFRRNRFAVSPTGYFVYVNGKRAADAFDNRLEFDAKIIPYTGDDAWIEHTVIAAHEALMGNTIPSSAAECDYCRYRLVAAEAEK